MITGFITSRLDGMIRLTVRGPHGKVRRIRAVVDTGYNGWLTLPMSMIDDLELEWMETGTVTLADGSETQCDIYEGEVIWHRRRVPLLVDEADATPLVGMELLCGSELRMKVRRGGKFTIKPIRGR